MYSFALKYSEKNNSIDKLDIQLKYETKNTILRFSMISGKFSKILSRTFLICLEGEKVEKFKKTKKSLMESNKNDKSH